MLIKEPQATGNCKRLNGKWAVTGTCDQYIGKTLDYYKETN